MTQPVPTVNDLLARTHIGGHFHEWGADGGVIRVTRAELRQALEAAYDETTPDWPSMVEMKMPDQSPEWIREALKLYFVARPGIHVDSVDLIGYFHVASVLDAAQDLVDAGWLTRTDSIYPKLKRSDA